MQQQQQQSLEIKEVRHQFEKMLVQAPENQKEKILEIKNFMVETIKHVETIRKNTNDSNLDFCNVVVGNQIKSIAGRISNHYFLVSKNPKLSKKFLTLVSKISISKLKKPFKNIQKDKKKINTLTEEECEIYSEDLIRPLNEYIRKLVLKMNEIEMKLIG